MSQKNEIIKMQIIVAQTYAQWWIAAANNGVAEQRLIYMNDKLLTPEALRKEAMDTAMRHIQRMNDLIEAIEDE